MEEESREVKWSQATKELECLAAAGRCSSHQAHGHGPPYSSPEPASAESTMYYGCDEVQAYRGGENSLIFAIIFALLGLTVQSHMDVITHDVLLSMTLGRPPGVGNASAVFLPWKLHIPLLLTNHTPQLSHVALPGCNACRRRSHLISTGCFLCSDSS